jgi:hypothetical protein
MFQQHSRSCFITAEKYARITRLNEKHLYTQSYHEVALQINFYGSCNFTENRSLLSNCQRSQSRKMGNLDFSFHHTPKVLCIYVYTYRAVLDEMWCHSQFNYVISVVLHGNVINTWFTNSVFSQSVHLKRSANGH